MSRNPLPTCWLVHQLVRTPCSRRTILQYAVLIDFSRKLATAKRCLGASCDTSFVAMSDWNVDRMSTIFGACGALLVFRLKAYYYAR